MSTTLLSLGDPDPAQQIVTAGGDYVAAIAPLTDNPKITFSGPSVFNLDGVTTVVASYAIEAIDGAVLTINGLASVASLANLVIDDASTIAIATGVSALSTIEAAFTGIGGTLSFAPGLLSALDPIPTVTGFAPGNRLDLGSVFVEGEQAAYSADTGILALETASGSVLGAVKLVGSYLPSSFTVTESLSGQAQIDLACFLRGTLIRTPDGEVAVERLRSGDLVLTGSGDAVPIKAVHVRWLDRNVHGWRVQPICIMEGALAQNVPSRDLYVSPDHAMYVDGVLIPAGLLQNGQTIFLSNLSGVISYFHIEVDPHTILVADGAPTESYLDIGNRNQFGATNTIVLLPAADPKTWEDACAPLVLTGPALDEVRRCVRARVEDCLQVASRKLSRVA